jgi:serine phosphatase RsbU (regulator of sigma subunit)
LLLTDGLYEGHAGAAGRSGDGRLGMDGLAALVTGLGAASAPADALLDGLVTETRSLNGGDLADDLALLWIGTNP